MIPDLLSFGTLLIKLIELSCLLETGSCLILGAIRLHCIICNYNAVYTVKPAAQDRQPPVVQSYWPL